MKRLLCIAVLALLSATGTLSAQNYIVVNSEKIFKSVDAYNQAITTIDALGEQYQKQVDAKFAAIETLYNNYVNQKNLLSQSAQQNREAEILAQEKAATAFQESIFGTEGTLIKKRVELIQPIQKRVFEAINQYAKAHGCDLVLDAASNPAMLYNATTIDKTNAIINSLK
ncbi:MAG: OmpH family outer membrane protein [Alistipes sp.]